LRLELAREGKRGEREFPRGWGSNQHPGGARRTVPAPRGQGVVGEEKKLKRGPTLTIPELPKQSREKMKRGRTEKRTATKVDSWRWRPGVPIFHCRIPPNEDDLRKGT